MIFFQNKILKTKLRSISLLFFGVSLFVYNFLVFFSCERDLQPIEEIHILKSKALNYNLNSPSKKVFLSSKLKEISGLSLSKKKNSLIAVNDEQGILFELNIANGDLIKELKFGKKGDYEGVENVEGEDYIVKSSGTIILVDSLKNDVKEKFNTFLRTDNNVEGLAFDKSNNQLLLACKGNAELKNKSQKSRAIYSFDLSSKELDSIPYILIRDKQIENFIIQNYPSKAESFLERQQQSNLVKRGKNFSPSGIAIHPKNQNLYILSSVGKTMIVCNSKGKILNLIFLNSSKYTQPEGICFSESMDLFIANEGGNGKASICVVPPEK